MDKRLTIQEPPSPWQKPVAFAVGGLLEVVYAADSDLLLVLSPTGRSVFDCATGAKIARDYNYSDDFFDPIRLMLRGFGPLAGQTV